MLRYAGYPRLGQRNALADVEAGKEREDEPAGRTTDDADAMRVDTDAVAFVVVTNDARPEFREARARWCSRGLAGSALRRPRLAPTGAPPLGWPTSRCRTR